MQLTPPLFCSDLRFHWIACTAYQPVGTRGGFHSWLHILYPVGKCMLLHCSFSWPWNFSGGIPDISIFNHITKGFFFFFGYAGNEDYFFILIWWNMRSILNSILYLKLKINVKHTRKHPNRGATFWIMYVHHLKQVLPFSIILWMFSYQLCCF